MGLRKLSVVAVAVAVGAGIVAVAVSTLAPRAVFAQTNVTFLVPINIQVIPAGGTDPGDVLVFTGKPIGTMTLDACGGGTSSPVQDGVVVDQGGGRATRLTHVIVTSQTTPLAPGTKVTDLAAGGACHTNGADYGIYTG